MKFLLALNEKVRPPLTSEPYTAHDLKIILMALRSKLL